MGGELEKSPREWTPKIQAGLESDEIRHYMLAHEMSKVSVNMKPENVVALFDGLAALVKGQVAV